MREQREEAVRSAGLAARAAVLQGNIQTATQLAKDTVDLAYKDRTLEAQNLIAQINYFQGIADDQTSQLLERDKRQYEAELAQIEELKTNIANAMVSGATQSEIATLNDPNTPDADKLALAQQITARGANEMRNLDIAQSQASIRASNASAQKAETDRLLNLAEAGNQDAIDALGLTTTDNSAPTADEIAYARQYASTGTIPSGLSSAGISFGKIQELAADLPKPDGTLVSRDTGVAPDGLSATEQTGYENLYNAINTDLPVLIEMYNKIEAGLGTGLVTGVKESVAPSDATVRYNQAKADFLAKLLVARSGAAVTEQEYERYANLIPGVFNTTFGIGSPGTEKLSGLQTQMETALNDKLATRGLSIYGYSTLDINGEEYTVGEIITSEYGQQGRVNPDGSITLINQ